MPFITDSAAVDAACQALIDAWSNYNSITPTPTNVNFRMSTFKKIITAASHLYPFKEILEHRPEIKELVYESRKKGHQIQKDVPGYRMPEQQLREINWIIEHYESVREARREAKAAKKLAKEAKEAAKDASKAKGKGKKDEHGQSEDDKTH
ncbi:hypothetical protein FB451DRAFT_1170326 [Mycena latifolia]|nr:hypothetical protein FB451DRAFT_1170326 [Mycena latifolia]